MILIIIIRHSCQLIYHNVEFFFGLILSRFNPLCPNLYILNPLRIALFLKGDAKFHFEHKELIELTMANCLTPSLCLVQPTNLLLQPLPHRRAPLSSRLRSCIDVSFIAAYVSRLLPPFYSDV